MDLMDVENKDLIAFLVTPVAPYFICNHFISTEIDIIRNDANKELGIDLHLRANNLIINNNYNDIKNFDIILVQVNLFDFFYDVVLPFLCENNIKIILITCQVCLPQIQINYKTDDLLNNNNIILWVSQNPIYTDNKKYMEFPYGIHYNSIIDYVNFMKSNNINIEKKINILNQQASIHSHLPENHIRRKFDIFGKNSGDRLDYAEYLTHILNSEFVISTSGDRDDCYRHFECIGLNAIPVSNIDGGYKEIFEKNMVYSDAKNMINMINNNTFAPSYKKPNRNIITISYWVNKLNNKINLLNES
jgi:hypothetical protein